VQQRPTSHEDREQSSSGENRGIGASRILALIRLDDREAMGQLAAFHQDLEICATAKEFVEKCSGSQYEVAILPTGVLPEDDRVLLRSYLTSMELHPSIVLYSPTSASQHWLGRLEAEDISIIMRPFTEARLRDAISHAVEEFGKRSRRRRC
jgi:AmiR/NasT family two-component response regulator